MDLGLALANVGAAWRVTAATARCGLCRDVARDVRYIPCGHFFCRQCLARATKDEYVCPTCRVPFFHRDVHKHFHMEAMVELDGAMQSILDEGRQFTHVPTAPAPVAPAPSLERVASSVQLAGQKRSVPAADGTADEETQDFAASSVPLTGQKRSAPAADDGVDGETQGFDPGQNWVPAPRLEAAPVAAAAAAAAPPPLDDPRVDETPRWKRFSYTVGDYVVVSRLKLPGHNREGGSARVTHVRDDNTFDVTYVVYRGSDERLTADELELDGNAFSDRRLRRSVATATPSRASHTNTRGGGALLSPGEAARRKKARGATPTPLQARTPASTRTLASRHAAPREHFASATTKRQRVETPRGAAAVPRRGARDDGGATAGPMPGPRTSSRVTSSSQRHATPTASTTEGAAKAPQHDAARGWTCRVLFTGIAADETALRGIEKLGAVLVERARDATHVVVGSVLKRTPKLMAAISVAVHVVGESWLRDAARGVGTIASARDHSARFPDAERKWHFSITESLASHVKIFDGCGVLMLDTVRASTKLPTDVELREIVECAGGTWLGERAPPPFATDDVVVIVPPKDSASQRALAKAETVLDLLGAKLRAALEPEEFYTAVLTKRLCDIRTTRGGGGGAEAPQSHLAEPPVSKRRRLGSGVGPWPAAAQSTPGVRPWDQFDDDSQDGGDLRETGGLDAGAAPDEDPPAPAAASDDDEEPSFDVATQVSVFAVQGRAAAARRGGDDDDASSSVTPDERAEMDDVDEEAVDEDAVDEEAVDEGQDEDASPAAAQDDGDPSVEAEASDDDDPSFDIATQVDAFAAQDREARRRSARRSAGLGAGDDGGSASSSVAPDDEDTAPAPAAAEARSPREDVRASDQGEPDGDDGAPAAAPDDEDSPGPGHVTNASPSEAPSQDGVDAAQEAPARRGSGDDADRTASSKGGGTNDGAAPVFASPDPGEDEPAAAQSDSRAVGAAAKPQRAAVPSDDGARRAAGQADVSAAARADGGAAAGLVLDESTSAAAPPINFDFSDAEDDAGEPSQQALSQHEPSQQAPLQDGTSQAPLQDDGGRALTPLVVAADVGAATAERSDCAASPRDAAPTISDDGAAHGAAAAATTEAVHGAAAADAAEDAVEDVGADAAAENATEDAAGGQQPTAVAAPLGAAEDGAADSPRQRVSSAAEVAPAPLLEPVRAPPRDDDSEIVTMRLDGAGWGDNVPGPGDGTSTTPIEDDEPSDDGPRGAADGAGAQRLRPDDDDDDGDGSDTTAGVRSRADGGRAPLPRAAAAAEARRNRGSAAAEELAPPHRDHRRRSDDVAPSNESQRTFCSDLPEESQRPEESQQSSLPDDRAPAHARASSSQYDDLDTQGGEQTLDTQGIKTLIGWGQMIRGASIPRRRRKSELSSSTTEPLRSSDASSRARPRAARRAAAAAMAARPAESSSQTDREDDIEEADSPRAAADPRRATPEDTIASFSDADPGAGGRASSSAGGRTSSLASPLREPSRTPAPSRARREAPSPARSSLSFSVPWQSRSKSSCDLVAPEDDSTSIFDLPAMMNAVPRTASVPRGGAAAAGAEDWISRRARQRQTTLTSFAQKPR
ncbi:hypothetical protein M885DRAFT_549603 [Pelagophyceae sp. CCMP2097]|nr:hypothetical protein M885DRAFT_549603 [Pelagophyceae sp. CCMP2097]